MGHLQLQYVFDENEIIHIIIFKTVNENVNLQKDNITQKNEDLKKNIA